MRCNVLLNFNQACYCTSSPKPLKCCEERDLNRLATLLYTPLSVHLNLPTELLSVTGLKFMNVSNTISYHYLSQLLSVLVKFRNRREKTTESNTVDTGLHN